MKTAPGRQTFTNQPCRSSTQHLPPESNICRCLAHLALLFQLLCYVNNSESLSSHWNGDTSDTSSARFTKELSLFTTVSLKIVTLRSKARVKRQSVAWSRLRTGVHLQRAASTERLLPEAQLPPGTVPLPQHLHSSSHTDYKGAFFWDRSSLLPRWKLCKSIHIRAGIRWKAWKATHLMQTSSQSLLDGALL